MNDAKIEQLKKASAFLSLKISHQNFIVQVAQQHSFSFQQLKTLTDIAIDLEMWQEGELSDLWPSECDNRKQIIDAIKKQWDQLRSKLHDYANFNPEQIEQHDNQFIKKESSKLALGTCPVSSPKTRCCQLLTLDAFSNCGQDCSYCAIQSFFSDNKIHYDPDFNQKLKELKLDKDKLYHIGTGQSSDSLMWGNKNGHLQALIDFAADNPNVILELKSKSNNIDYLLERDLPSNIICTWTLNTPTIIENEEYRTTTAIQRIEAALALSEKGVLVGFHFHPMVYYKGWEQEYSELFEMVKSSFSPSQIALISFGTLTYIRPVIQKIRKRKLSSKILQMEMIEADGKLSYPDEIKLSLFKHAYQSFANWHDSDIFFYLCMENERFWKPVFGYDYQSNDDFESAMKKSYFAKIKR